MDMIIINITLSIIGKITVQKQSSITVKEDFSWFTVKEGFPTSPLNRPFTYGRFKGGVGKHFRWGSKFQIDDDGTRTNEIAEKPKLLEVSIF